MRPELKTNQRGKSGVPAKAGTHSSTTRKPIGGSRLSPERGVGGSIRIFARVSMAKPATGHQRRQAMPHQPFLPELLHLFHHAGHILILLQEAVDIWHRGARSRRDA